MGDVWSSTDNGETWTKSFTPPYMGITPRPGGRMRVTMVDPVNGTLTLEAI